LYGGQVCDADCFAAEPVRSAQPSLVLTDNYADDSAQTLFSKKSGTVSATVYTVGISQNSLSWIQKNIPGSISLLP